MSQPASSDDFAAELHRGWGAAICSGVAMGVGLALFLATTGLFMKPLSQAFHWSRGLIGLVSVGYLASAVLTSPMGALADRIGVRPVAFGGMVVLSLAYVGLSQLRGDLRVFYAFAFVAEILGVAANAIILTQPLVRLFSRFRGAALGFSLGFAQLIIMAIVPLTQLVIATRGWRSGYLLLACMPGVLGLAAVALLPAKARSRRSKVIGAEEGATLPQALADRRFWLMFGALLSAGFGFGGIIAHLPALLSDRKVGALSIGLVMSIFGGATGAGRLLEGVLMDRLWAPAVAGITYVLPIAGLTILLQSTGGMVPAILAALLLGLGSGSEINQVSFFAARYFGPRAYGSIYGALAAAISVSIAIGGWMFGVIFDSTGSYDVALTIGACGLACAGVLMFATGFAPLVARPISRSLSQ
jgi:predicted MFS family arabinose efflux permease